MRTFKYWLYVLVALTGAISLLLTACSGGTPKIWSGQIVRDLDTLVTTDGGVESFKAVYINEGSSIESQRLDIYSQGGAWNAMKIGYTKSGNQLNEYLQIQGPRTFENYSLMTAEEQDENVLNITKSGYTVMRWVDTNSTSYQTAKNEISFSFPALGQDPLKYESTYIIPMNGEEPNFTSANNYYDVLSTDTILGDRWSPYSVVIENSLISRTLKANWAQSNMSFDAAMAVTHDTLLNLNSNGWTTMDPTYGSIKMVLYNKNGARELIGFEHPFYGTAYDANGRRYDFRIKPTYQILDQNLYFGWGKQNSRNASLQSLQWQLLTGNNPDDDSSWTTVSAMVFLKGRFAANSLYAFKMMHPGETVESLITSLKQEMDADIPEDIRKVMDQPFDQGGPVEQRIMNWVASRQPFDLGNLVRKYGLSAAATVRYQDISDKIRVLEPCGEDCSRWVTIVTTPRKQLVWNMAVAPGGAEDINDMLTLGSENFAKAFDIGYVQPGAGDGMSYIFGALRSYIREHQGTAGYPEAVRLDQRVPITPEGINAAIEHLFVQYYSQ